MMAQREIGSRVGDLHARRLSPHGFLLAQIIRVVVQRGHTYTVAFNNFAPLSTAALCQNLCGL